MRVLICSLTMLLTLLFGYNMIGQTVEKSRTVTETFKVEPGTEIEIINKYGNIHLIPWEKDSVQFTIARSSGFHEHFSADTGDDSDVVGWGGDEGVPGRSGRRGDRTVRSD